MVMPLPGIALVWTGPSDVAGFCAIRFSWGHVQPLLGPLQCYGASQRGIPGSHFRPSSCPCIRPLLQTVVPRSDSATAWAALGLLLLPYALCFLRWSLLHLPKPSMNGTEKHSFLPLTSYYHLTFPDGMSGSIKPPACQNCQARSRHQALCLHMPQTPGRMSSLPRTPVHSPIHSISTTGK